MEAELEKIKVEYETLSDMGLEWIRIQATYIVDGPRSEVEEKIKFPKTIELEEV